MHLHTECVSGDAIKCLASSANSARPGWPMAPQWRAIKFSDRAAQIYATQKEVEANAEQQQCLAECISANRLAQIRCRSSTLQRFHFSGNSL